MKLKNTEGFQAYEEEHLQRKYSGQLTFYHWIAQALVFLLGDMTLTHQTSLVDLQIRAIFSHMQKICFTNWLERGAIT